MKTKQYKTTRDCQSIHAFRVRNLGAETPTETFVAGVGRASDSLIFFVWGGETMRCDVGKLTFFSL